MTNKNWILFIILATVTIILLYKVNINYLTGRAVTFKFCNEKCYPNGMKHIYQNKCYCDLTVKVSQ